MYRKRLQISNNTSIENMFDITTSRIFICNNLWINNGKVNDNHVGLACKMRDFLEQKVSQGRTENISIKMIISQTKNSISVMEYVYCALTCKF